MSGPGDDRAPGWNCPLPDDGAGPRVALAHGEGARLTRKLLRERVLPALARVSPAALDAPGALGDAAWLPLAELGGDFTRAAAGGTARLAFTTDGFIVTPLFFPGGDIGKLAVFGTVNDLVVSGARPRWLSLSLVLEEGLPLATLDRVLASVAQAAREAGVMVVTGDTKVAPRGAVDGLFVNTAGVGAVVEPAPPGPAALRVGDQLLVTGPIGRHGMAVLCARENLGFEPAPTSDCASLLEAVEALWAAALRPVALRDATRGGVAAVLHEWAESCRLTLAVDERLLPVSDDVRGACELLGLEPLHVANEGTMVVAVAPERVEPALAALRSTGVARGAARVGEVLERTLAPVVLRRGFGRETPLDEPAGAPLPRIC